MNENAQQRERWSFHEAGYAVAARALGIAIRPPSSRRGLRLFEDDVFGLPLLFMADSGRSAEELERMALVALAGHAALNRVAGGMQRDRDGLLARDLILAGLIARYDTALLPGFVRTYIRSRFAELTAEAEQLVAERWPAIQTEAALILAAPRRQAG